MAVSTGKVRSLYNALAVGEIDRRTFVQRCGALGIATSMSMYMASAAAQTPAASPVAGAKGGGGLESAIPRAEAPADQVRGAGGEFRIVQWQAPTIAVAHLATGDKDVLASALVQEPLMHYGQDAGLLPNLVTDIPSIGNGDLAEDLSTVTLHLMEGVTWSDGEPFTANDVRFTWQWVTDPVNASTNQEVWGRITEIEVVDDYTLTATFDSPNPLWYQPFTGNATGTVLPAHVLEGADQATSDAFRSNPVGTGPFVITDFQANDAVQYAANENYRDANKPFFSSVQLKGGGEPAAAARAVLQTGEFHYAWFLTLDADLIQELAQGDAGKLLLFSQGYAERMHLNHSDPNTEVNGQRSEMNTPHPFLSDVNVRRAMMLAIDRQLIVDQLFIEDSVEKPAKDVFTGISSLESPNTTLEFDPDQANTLLDEAGWVLEGDVRVKDGVELAITYFSTTNQLRQKIQSVVKANLESVGFKVDIQNIDSTIYFDSSSGNDQNTGHFYYDVNMHQTSAGAPTPITFMQSWYAGPEGENISQMSNDWTGPNQTRYRSDEYDALFDEVRTETDAARQLDLFIQMNDHLIENAALIPLVAVAERSACAAWLDDSLCQLGPFGMDYWNIANWAGTPPG